MDLPDPCPRCGWKYGGFHVCIVLTPKEIAEVHKRSLMGTMTDAHRIRLEQDKAKAEHKRNEKIITIYQAGNIGVHAIARELHVASSTVRNILHQAEKEGRLTVRKPPHALANKGAQ